MLLDVATVLVGIFDVNLITRDRIVDDMVMTLNPNNNRVTRALRDLLPETFARQDTGPAGNTFPVQDVATNR